MAGLLIGLPCIVEGLSKMRVGIVSLIELGIDGGIFFEKGKILSENLAILVKELQMNREVEFICFNSPSSLRDAHLLVSEQDDRSISSALLRALDEISRQKGQRMEKRRIIIGHFIIDLDPIGVWESGSCLSIYKWNERVVHGGPPTYRLF